MFAEGDGFRCGSNAGDGAGEESAAATAAAACCGWSAEGTGDNDGRRALIGTARATTASPGGFIGEGEGDFDLGVLGEGFGTREVDGAARAVRTRCPGAEGAACAVAVAEKEI